MIKINQKTLIDLEFPTICTQLSEHCITDLGKKKALASVPFTNENDTLIALDQTQEYKKSALEDARIPNHGFDSVTEEIKILAVENTILEIRSFRKIAQLSETANTQILFFRKHKALYPNLFQRTDEVYFTTALIEKIQQVIDRFGELRNNASPLLQQIRKNIHELNAKINSSFTNAMSRYHQAGYLDDIKESVVENIRVLAVTAMHRRKVKGSILGSSKTGSIVYIQPETTLQYSRELNNLKYEEKEEIKRILKELTEHIRPHRLLLKSYQELLSDIDLIAAKVTYANRMKGIMPKITTEHVLELKEAYHPLLLLNNLKKNKTTFPQDIHLNPENRIIVISGPNAGGKSITLKTIGLLQVMLQSGMLIPVHEYTRMCLFSNILTDIGDNQSIENHLSTYSYRLKNMKYFLRKCNDKTLFLIDEFGTGSDPELGGALAESFLEVFYEKQAYGIITTHYANLKKMAHETPGISNANMLFDSKTLEPKFQLHLGEAGSSFTFEVAQKNGIPYSLINRAKKKVERGKIRFDKSIAKLQQERSKLTKTNENLKKQEQHTVEEQKKLEKTNAKIQQKLENYQELYDTHQKYIYLGQKIDTLNDKFFQKKNKKELIAEFLKLVAIENAKRKKVTKKQKQAQKALEEKVKKEAEQKVTLIREKKKKEKIKEAKKQQEETIRKIQSFKINDRVRLIDSKAVGTIDKIEKNMATVNYGMFTTLVALDKLDLVQRAKS